MNLIHKGVVSMEAAVLLGVFVLIGGAMAFVVVNMGSSVSDKEKTVISSGLLGSSSSLFIPGRTTGFADVPNTELNATEVPIRIRPGGDSVDLNDSRVAVTYLSNNLEYSDILTAGCTLSGTSIYQNTSLAFDQAVIDGCLTVNPLIPPWGVPANTKAVIYWNISDNTDNILDPGEHAVLAIAWNAADRPNSLDTLRAEIITPGGSTLFFERTLRIISTPTIDLG